MTNERRARSRSSACSTFLLLILLWSTSSYAQLVDAGAPGRDDGAGTVTRPPYRDASRPVEERVEDLLVRMTLAEKIGQMTQAEQQTASPSTAAELFLGGMLSGGDSAPTPNTVASWAKMLADYQSAAEATRLHIPLLYGVDAVHGGQLVAGATVFPHLLGLAATRDGDLLRRVGAVTAQEMAATGVYWAFSPMVAVTQDERWGRTFESFGEDTQTVTEMASAYVHGMMSALGPGLPVPLPTAKHFIGDGGTTFGSSETRNFLIDQGDTRGSTQRLLSKFLPPYEALLAAGTGSVMASFNRWNGVRMVANRALLTGTLKGTLGFKGFVVSDWEGFRVLPGSTHQEIVAAVNAGIDMTMAPQSYREFISELTSAVRLGEVSQARIDDAVRRILRVKFSMGLFEHSAAVASLAAEFGSPAHRAVAREAVAKSATLLKNDSALPIPRGATVFVTGSHADNLGLQCGGWTLQWQGVTTSAGLIGTTLLAGLRSVGGETTRIVYAEDGQFSGHADFGVLFVGERPYAEGLGDRPMAELVLSASDRASLSALRKRVTKLIVVLVAGRPLVLNTELSKMDALVMAWLPGVEGAGVADVLFGDTPFSGRLPIGWPRTVSGYQRADAELSIRCSSLEWSDGFGLNANRELLGPVACPAPRLAQGPTRAQLHAGSRQPNTRRHH